MRTSAVYASRDPNRAAVIIEALQAGQVSVTVLQRAREVSGFLAQRGSDLLLIGQKLADADGLDVVKQIRTRGPARQIPIVALVEHAEAAAPASNNLLPNPRAASSAAAKPGGTSLRLAFFQAGADECLSLNWDAAECVARIKAVLRRTSSSQTEEVIKMGPIELNLTSYTLHIRGQRVPLTSKELDLLYVFLSSANRVLSRPYLIERVWGYSYFGSPRTVDVHVRRLREKLGPAARFITTIPCVGYKLVPPGASIQR